MESIDVVDIWHRAGNPTPASQLRQYAQALTAGAQLGTYHSLSDEQEDAALLALIRFRPWRCPNITSFFTSWPVKASGRGSVVTFTKIINIRPLMGKV